jgi:hypothetical protein
VPVGRPSSQPAGLIQKLPLTDMAAYSIGIHDRLPTTILLPQIPSAFTGVGFTKDKATAAPVYIEHTPGTTWFTVRALMPDAEAELNVLMAGKLYTFHFFQSNTPLRTLTLFVPQSTASTRPSGTVHTITVKRLVEILDDAKAYLTIRSLHPNLYRQIEFAAPGAKTPYRDFDILTDMVFKFPSDDTLVFRIVFLNRAETPLHYDPQVVGARVRGTPSTFWKSISDLDGVVPAAVRSRQPDGSVVMKPGQSFGYFAITGNPDGSVAGLSIKNAFDILVKRQAAPSTATPALSPSETPSSEDPASV